MIGGHLKGSEGIVRAACVLTVAIATYLVIDAPPAYGQGDSGGTPAHPLHNVRTETTRSLDGLTLTKKTTADGVYGAVSITVVTTRGQDGRIVSEVTTKSDDDHADISIHTIDTKTFDAHGDYSETIDKTYSDFGVYSGGAILKNNLAERDELQCDAAGNILSGTRVKVEDMTRDGAEVLGPPLPRKYTWDVAAQDWVYAPHTSLTPAQPNTINAADGPEHVIAPPVSSPGKEILVSDRGLSNGGFLVSIWSNQIPEPRCFYAPIVHQAYIDVPANAKSVSVVQNCDPAGKPDANARVITVSADAPVPGMTMPSASAPAGQPAIVASAGAYEVLSGLISVQTQNTSVADTLVLDTEQPLTTLAASDRSVVAALPSNLPLGRHELSLEPLIPSQIASPSSVPFDAISLTVDPMPAVENVGDTATPTVHVSGMIPGDVAVMEFAIGGSAELASGGTFTSVPVVGNVASTTIVGVRSGEALVRFHLRMLSLAPLPPK